jgi:hypothetical protein
MAVTYIAALLLAATPGAQQSLTLNVPGTPEGAPTVLSGCLMPAGGTTSMPGSGGSSGTGPAGMNADAANSGVFFTLNLGKRKKSSTKTSYALEGVDAGELKKYANSRVEVHGVLVPPAEPTGTAADVSVSTVKKKPSTSPSRFRVTAIKQVPGSCGGQ